MAFKDSLLTLKFDIRKDEYKPFTQDEELNIFNKFKNETDLNKKQEIRNTILMRNFRFMAYIISNEFRATILERNISINHLFGLACEGMINAINKYDHTRGIRFANYAIFYIRKELYNELYRSNGVFSGAFNLNRYYFLINSLKRKNPDITEDEIMNKLNITKSIYEKVKKLSHVNENIVELDKTLFNDDSPRARKATEMVSKTSEEEEKLIDSIFRDQLRNKLEYILNDKEIFHTAKSRNYFIEYFYNNKSYHTIGEMYNVSKQNVCHSVNTKLKLIKLKYKKELMSFLFE